MAALVLVQGDADLVAVDARPYSSGLATARPESTGSVKMVLSFILLGGYEYAPLVLLREDENKEVWKSGSTQGFIYTVPAVEQSLELQRVYGATLHPHP